MSNGRDQYTHEEKRRLVDAILGTLTECVACDHFTYHDEAGRCRRCGAQKVGG